MGRHGLHGVENSCIHAKSEQCKDAFVDKRRDVTVKNKFISTETEGTELFPMEERWKERITSD